MLVKFCKCFFPFLESENERKWKSPGLAWFRKKRNLILTIILRFCIIMFLELVFLERPNNWQINHIQ